MANLICQTVYCQGTRHREPLLLHKDVVDPDHRTIVLGTPRVTSHPGSQPKARCSKTPIFTSESSYHSRIFAVVAANLKTERQKNTKSLSNISCYVDLPIIYIFSTYHSHIYIYMPQPILFHQICSPGLQLPIPKVREPGWLVSNLLVVFKTSVKLSNQLSLFWRLMI